MEGKGKAPTSSTEVYSLSLSSSDSRYCSRRYMSSTIPKERDLASPHQGPIHIIGHPRDAIINQTLQDIQELKNRQALTDHVLNNIFSSSHGKPHVTCLASGEASSIKEIIV